MRNRMVAIALLAAFQLAAPARGETVITGARQHVPMIALAGPTTLKAGRTVVKLRRTQHAPPDRPVFALLAIYGLAFDSPPGVMYEVYLQGRSGRRALLGVINFYNQTAPGYNGVGAIRIDALSDQSFSATQALRLLGGDASILVFEPTSGVTGPAIRANPRARVRFSSATLAAR